MSSRREWKLEKADSSDRMEIILNGLTRAGWELHSVKVIHIGDKDLDRTGMLYIALFWRDTVTSNGVHNV